MASPVWPFAPADGKLVVSFKTLLKENAVWTGKYHNLEHDLRLNKVIHYRQNNAFSTISLVASQDNALVASLSRDEGSSDIKIIVYRTGENSLEEVWTSTAVFKKSPEQVLGIAPSCKRLDIMRWKEDDDRTDVESLRPTKVVLGHLSLCQVPSIIPMGISPVTIVTFSSCETEVVLGMVDMAKSSTCILRGPGHQVLQVRIGDARGISLLGLTTVAEENYGFLVTFSIMTGAWKDIQAVETYFDTADATLRAIGRNPPTKKLGILHWWTISNGPVTRELSNTRPLTTNEREHQLALFNSIFLNDRFATYVRNTTIIQDRVFHLMTMTYPWDHESKVYVFAVRMEYEYSIVAMAAVKQVTAEPYLIRVLFVSERYSFIPETADIVQNGPHYVLQVQEEADRPYSGMALPSKRVTIIGHHFMLNDAPYDFFVIGESTSPTMRFGDMDVSPNISLTANVAAYFPPRYIGSGAILDYGHRTRPSYVMPKFKIWLDYTHRSGRNELFDRELMDQLGEHSTMVFDDPLYDPLFPSGFATAATLDILSNRTLFVDEFMKRYHRSDALIISNSHAISYSLPSVCRARPLGVLSFMRHIALLNFKLAENTAVIVSNRAHERHHRPYFPRNKFLAFFRDLFSLLLEYKFIPPPRKKMEKTNTTAITIPLDGFCTYDCHIYNLPLSDGGRNNEVSKHFYNMAESAYYDEVVTGETRKGYAIADLTPPSRPGRSIRTSPFTCLVEELFRIDDHELQFSIVKVIWFEKLIDWKLKTFGQYVYLSRIVLPSLANWILQVTLSILTSGGRISTAILLLGGIQAFICAYLMAQKFRQARATRLFFRSFYNFMDIIAIGLSIANSVLVLTRNSPPRPFVAYTTAIVWTDVLLSARMYESAGVLMILLTEMMKGVLPFLILLALFMVGFTFIPFLLLKDRSTGPFVNYNRSLGEMITFMTNDFTSLEPFTESLVSIQVLRAVFTVLFSILLLNSLIALLNLRVEAADNRSRTIWRRQMAAMIVEIERGILTARERKNPRWFPRWFTYNITEDEKNQWQYYIDKQPLGLGYGPDSSPDPTVTSSRVQEGITPESPSPAPQGSPTNDTPTVPTAVRSTTATSPSPTTTKTPAERPSASQPSTRPSSARKPSVSNPSATSAPIPTSSTLTPPNAATPTSTMARPTMTDALHTQPLDPPTKLPTSSETSTTPLPAPASTSTSQPPAGSTMITQPSTSTAATSSFQETLPQVASHKSGRGDVKEEMISQKCQICPLVETKLCSGCRRVRYCSEEHQKQDWAVHRKVCERKAGAE
ncbi:hypothetical protein BU17DRAFT_65658 [Hysterangium stoloniferum]|nr:hypothetical protein BU17DRAFT_65658 [Hysterangium stoloniferum]